MLRRKDLGLPEHITLLPECEEDRTAAANAAVLKARHKRMCVMDTKSRRRAVMRSSIFDDSATKYASEDAQAVNPGARKHKTILDKARFVARLQQARPGKPPSIRVRRTAR